MALPKENERYTYSDYCSWDNDERWELIDGVPYAMTPAPSRFHQTIKD
ncbi:MAG: Uma2 family endonuclease [Peptococcaceae bacterium]|nr:Uma2 family endonuclease [Peptococcaceae bacterium]